MLVGGHQKKREGREKDYPNRQIKKEVEPVEGDRNSSQKRRYDRHHPT